MPRLDERVGRARIDLERRRDQPVRLARLAALVVEHAKQMQRVEIVALQLQRARIELLGLVEAALLMQRHAPGRWSAPDARAAGRAAPSLTAG